MDVSTWLRDLGLAHYAEAFRANDIDAEVLPRLTAEDLIALGITSIGHRRKLLDAIAALDQASAPAAAEPVAVRPLEAERRQLTVLFCDLVGSTELAACLDPEDLREVMRAYQATCAEVVCRFEGHVARFLGDGVLAYFGWPRAHEDDAEQAVRAGLELVQEIARLEPRAGVRLQARVGIATGRVVVGDLISEGVSDKDAVSGDTPNLAARLQAVAAPASVVISPSTRRLVGGLFELTDLGSQRLKGFAEPLTVWQVEGQRRAEGRFEARQTSGLTPLVGREEEIALLLRRWRQARDGEGQVVLLSGEPGIGKSRLVRELRRRLEGEPHLRLLYQCSPHHMTSPLHPLIEQLERAASFEREDTAEAKLGKLEALLARGTQQLEHVVPLVAALLGLPAGDRFPLPELTPQRQKQLTLEALVGQLDGLAAGQPVLLVYEDVHWIDPTTQELLGLAIERIQRLPVLAIVTFRPELVPPWSGQPHLSALALTRLGRRDGAAMVDRVVGDKPLPAEVCGQILGKTDGVPLFVEELTKTVLESGLLRDAGDHWELDGPLPALAIPSTLQDSLMARLDRLAPVKEAAQIGAAIGRVFSHQLLAAVSPLDEAQLRAALERLVEAELVFRQGSPPTASYTFKHALVQDAAYQSLLKSRRADLHGRIANALERDFPQLVDAQPELLAHHHTEAGLVTQAVGLWLRAGEHAQARSAHLEAIAHLQRGLALVAQLPDAAEQARHELDFHAALGISLLATKGFAAPEVGQSYVKAEALSEQTAVTARLYAILQGLWFHHTVRCELERALELAQRCYRMACDDGDPAHLLAAHNTLCHSHFYFGSFEDSRTSLDEALRLADRAEQESLTTLIGADLAVFARALGAHTMWHLGFADQATQLSDHAIALARERQDPFTLGLVLDYASMLKQFARERDAAEALAAEAVELCRTQHFAYYLAWARMIHGWSMAAAGRVDDSLDELRAGLDAFEATGAGLRRSYYWSLLAEIEARAGRSGEGLVLLDDAIALVERTGERWHEAELHRLKGQLVLQTRPNRDEAETCFQQALAIARRQAARAPELQAALDLARLWAEEGERQKALDLLAQVYGWFTEGFDTADLKDAKALLDELA